MYKICGKVKETEKTLFFNCLFCHTERIFPVQSLSCCREREGVERRSVADLQGAAQQPDLALSAVYRSLLCDLVFWELLAVGAPGGTRLHCCRAWWSSTASLLSKPCFLQGPIFFVSLGWPHWCGRVARCQQVHS